MESHFRCTFIEKMTLNYRKLNELSITIIDHCEIGQHRRKPDRKENNCLVKSEIFFDWEQLLPGGGKLNHAIKFPSPNMDAKL